MRLVIFFLIGFYCQLAWSETTGNEEILYPPPIVFPYGGVIKLVVGIAAPVQLGGRILVYAQNFQFQYALPQNATFFTDYFTSMTKRKRRKRGGGSTSVDQRKIFYEFLEQELNRWCFNGKSCMLKSICQASKIPVADESLVGEILNVILTPDYGNVSSTSHVNYLDAAETGRRGDDCSVVYPGCPEGCEFLDRISKIYTSNLE